jgi:Mn-containing catalase
MYHHVRKLMDTVRVDAADPAFGNMLLEQFGGARWRTSHPPLLVDIGTEELSHLEIVGVLARLHLKP